MSKATELLVAYGYEDQGDGSFVRLNTKGKPKDRYVAVDGGFLHDVRDDGVWVPQAFQIHSDWAGIGGLTADTHPECFDMVHPEAWVEAEYGAALANRAQWAAEAAARKTGA